MTLIRHIEMIDPDDCVDNWWNPNTEKAEKFNALYESIQDLGMVENIQVVPLCEELAVAFTDKEDQQKVRGFIDDGKKWLVLHGSHRFEAAVMAGKDALPQIPAVIMETQDVAKLQAMSVRMNVIKGEIDADKFIQLWDSMSEQAPELTEEAKMDMVGFTSKAELDRLIKETKKDLPPEMQDALEAAKEEIKTVEDLSKVLNTLFTRFGEDLTYGFMTFQWGGKLHTMVRLTKQTNSLLARLKQYCRENQADMNDVLTVAMRHVLGDDETEWPEPLDRDLSIAE